MKKILILGGAGFIGSNLAFQLVQSGLPVKIFNRPNNAIANLGEIRDKVEIVGGDFMDDVAVRRALTDVDVVFHLISTTFPSMTVESSVYDVMSNLLPTIRFMEICMATNIKKIVYLSSGGTVYGEQDIQPISENALCLPKSAYGQSKYTIESYLQFYTRMYGLDISILRVSNPYGPLQNLYGIQGLIAVAMGCILTNSTLKLFGNGESVRDFIFISDVVTAMIRAMNLPGSDLFNISSGKGVSVMEMVTKIEAVTGKTIKKQFIPARAGDVGINVLANDKAQSILQWIPQVELMDGLARTWQWVTSQNKGSLKIV